MKKPAKGGLFHDVGKRRLVAGTRKRVCYNFCFWGYSAPGGKVQNGHQFAA
jgi:hypothetical protein